MPLPPNNTPWPLPGTKKEIRAEMAEHAAWYSGDPDRLRTLYGSKATSDATRPSKQADQGILGWLRSPRFWGRRGTDNSQVSERTQLHIPLAGDIATVSADLLFSEAPQIEIPEAHGSGEPTDGDNPQKSAARVAQDRLEEIIEEAGVHNTLLEAAEVAAAISGAYLRPVWDEAVADHPLLTVIQADDATPEFRFGVLSAVTFHRILVQDAGRVLRHLEKHEKGVIFHGLYEGTAEHIGRKVPLTEHPETAALADSLADGDEIRLDGFDDLFVRYVPNMLPNRRFRGSYIGRSDLQGIEGIMDALDEVYTSWMRDVRIGQARILVAQQYLDRGRDKDGATQPGRGAFFDIDKELFTALDFDPTDDTKGITPVEFELRAADHAATASDLLERAVSNAGYSLQSFGLKGDVGPATATEIRARERKSFATKAKKERYVQQPVAEVLEIMLAIDKLVFGGKHEVLRPRVGLSDSIAETTREMAESVSMLNQAEAASIKTRVTMMHPDWSDEEIAQEVEAIKSEKGVNVPAFPLPGDEG